TTQSTGDTTTPTRSESLDTECTTHRSRLWLSRDTTFIRDPNLNRQSPKKPFSFESGAFTVWKPATLWPTHQGWQRSQTCEKTEFVVYCCQFTRRTITSRHQPTRE